MAKPMTTKDKIREWISDNLRYMLLIGAILLIVAAVLLIVHLVSPKNDGKSSGGTVTSSSTGNNVPDKKTQVKADSKADSEDSTGISSDVSDSANDSSADASSTDTASAPDAEAEPLRGTAVADAPLQNSVVDNNRIMRKNTLIIKEIRSCLLCRGQCPGSKHRAGAVLHRARCKGYQRSFCSNR